MVFLTGLFVVIGIALMLCTSVILTTDEDTRAQGIMNSIGVILLGIGLLIGINKTQEVYCPECGDKQNPIFVAVDEHYCSSCGSEYIVLG